MTHNDLVKAASNIAIRRKALSHDACQEEIIDLVLRALHEERMERKKGDLPEQ